MVAHSEPLQRSGDQFLAAAVALGNEIHRHQQPTGGQPNWTGPRREKPERPFRLVPLDLHLYGGRAGIALFLAALGKTTGEARHLDLALATIAPLRRRIRELAGNPSRAPRTPVKMGGVFGIGSLIYTLVRVGELTSDETVHDDALAATCLITPERIASDHFLDLTLGSAGGCLALLALDRVRPRTGPGGHTPMELATACVEHLLARRIGEPGEPRAWPTMPDLPPQTGFSHGASGIAHALLSFYERTGDLRARDAAREGIAYEDRFFSPHHGNWRDLRVAETRFLMAWCHGAPGIVLARLTARRVDSTDPNLLRHALDTTLHAEPSPLDHVCCGNFGRAEVLLQAALAVNDPESLAGAHRFAHQALQTAAKRGYRWLYPKYGHHFDPSFFNGAAGVGYALLRLAGHKLPCVLSME